MFYKTRFDSAVGGILTHIGFRTTKEKLEFWPAGYSADFVLEVEPKGVTPNEAAAWAVCDLVTKQVKSGELERVRGLVMCDTALIWVAERGASTSFLTHIQRYVDGLR
jgi:hypothetical protein